MLELEKFTVCELFRQYGLQLMKKRSGAGEATEYSVYKNSERVAALTLSYGVFEVSFTRPDGLDHPIHQVATRQSNQFTDAGEFIYCMGIALHQLRALLW